MTEGMVSGAAMAAMVLAAVVSFGIPVVLFIYFRRKQRADAVPFFVGCGVFILFAMVLEAVVHRIVLYHTAAGDAILNHMLLYALYGGLMAGLFEETGRFLAFRTVLKKYRENDGNALMYGAGHGGCEAALLVGLTMISNLATAAVINSGQVASLTGSLSGEALTQMETALSALVTTEPSAYLFSILERFSAVAVHLSLSVLVWFSVKEAGRRWLFFAAVLLHALLDGITVLLNQALPIAVTELLVVFMAAGIAAFSYQIWKKAHVRDTGE